MKVTTDIIKTNACLVDEFAKLDWIALSDIGLFPSSDRSLVEVYFDASRKSFKFKYKYNSKINETFVVYCNVQDLADACLRGLK